MADCPNGNKKIIEITTSDDEVTRFIDVDSYSLEQEKGRCPVKYHAWGIYTSKNSSTCNQKQYWRTAYAFEGSLVNDATPTVSPNGYYVINDSNNQEYILRIVNESYWRSRNTRDERAFPIYFVEEFRNCQGGSSESGHSFSLTQILRQDGLPDDCGNCVLKIFKNDSVVYQKNYEKCPEVNEYCEDKNCPPNTCECTHGSIVCCHDSFTGEVVKRFRRYKNN